MDWRHHRSVVGRSLLSVRWITRVWEQSPYQGDKLLLHLALADFANDEGECWPSQRTLASKARCSQRWVRECIAGMVADGILEVRDQTLGRGGRTLYVLKGELSSSTARRQRGTTEQVKRNSGASLSISNKNHQEPSQIAAEFEQFWEEYPRRIAKAAARQAWAKLRQRPETPPIEAIITAVRLYASQVSDPKYICHPATWLRQERWNDEISEPKPSPKASEPSPFRHSESFAAGLKRAGRSRAEVEDALAGRSSDEVAAALAFYDSL